MAPTSLRQAWPALTGLAAVFLFEMLDNSILTVALPTIGRDLHASTVALQWVTGAYSVAFGGLMLAFGAVADRFGRRRVMLAGLTLLGAASLATALVTTAGQLIAVRAVMGVAAAMTTPGSAALAFRLFDDDRLRVRAMTLISTVGLAGLAVGPSLGGFVLAALPWQTLLLVNAPIAVLAIAGVRAGIARDTPAGLHRDPVDVPGALLGTATIVLTLLAPTLFVEDGPRAGWAATAGAVAAATLFVVRERTVRHPLLDLRLVAHPLVSSGLAYKAAAGLATAGLGYMVTLDLQLGRGWTPAHAALGMLPQVAVLIAGGLFVDPFVRRAGLERAAWISAISVVAGLAVFTLLHGAGYVFVAAALVLVAAGLRVVGVVAAVNVLRGLPQERTTIGAALTDTATEVTSGAGVAVTGTILAALFTGTITAPHWTAAQTAQFDGAVTVAGLTLTTAAAALVGWALLRTRRAATSSPQPRSGDLQPARSAPPPAHDNDPSAQVSEPPAHASGPSAHASGPPADRPQQLTGGGEPGAPPRDRDQGQAHHHGHPDARHGGQDRGQRDLAEPVPGGGERVDAAVDDGVGGLGPGLPRLVQRAHDPAEAPGRRSRRR